MWSLGIILIELATGEYPYKQSKSFIELLQNIQSTSEPNLPENDDRYSDLFRDFLRHCLNKDPMKRAKAIDLLVIT
jgi:mitogen-activated protein kinase kinase 7